MIENKIILNISAPFNEQKKYYLIVNLHFKDLPLFLSAKVEGLYLQAYQGLIKYLANILFLVINVLATILYVLYVSELYVQKIQKYVYLVLLYFQQQRYSTIQVSLSSNFLIFFNFSKALPKHTCRSLKKIFLPVGSPPPFLIKKISILASTGTSTLWDVVPTG